MYELIWVTRPSPMTLIISPMKSRLSRSVGAAPTDTRKQAKNAKSRFPIRAMVKLLE